MTKTRADQIQVGDKIDFAQHKYQSLWVGSFGQDYAERKVEGVHEVTAVEITKYKTTGRFCTHSPGSRGVCITYANGRQTFHNYSEKLPVRS